jgi:hypothetical protein
MSYVRVNGNSEGWTKEALRANEGDGGRRIVDEDGVETQLVCKEK